MPSHIIVDIERIFNKKGKRVRIWCKYPDPSIAKDAIKKALEAK